MQHYVVLMHLSHSFLSLSIQHTHTHSLSLYMFTYYPLSIACGHRCAPEVLRGDEYDAKVDLYSYGVMLWEMVARKQFFQGEDFWWRIEDKVINGERPDIPHGTSPEYRHIVERCWANAPSMRPTWEGIITLLLVLTAKLAPVE